MDNLWSRIAILIKFDPDTPTGEKGRLDKFLFKKFYESFQRKDTKRNLWGMYYKDKYKEITQS